jgi:endonuclease/exonuclease/phosphatase family metal-dependent hydrolase
MRVIRVMSFNIWNTGEPQPWEENPRAAWSKRAPLVVQAVRRYSPTIIGFQEFSLHHWETLGSQLADYTACVDFNTPEIGNTIFYRTDRFDLLDRGRFFCSHTPDEPTLDWGLEYPISVDWVLLNELESGWPLLFMNTQLEDGWDPNQVQMREEGSLIFLEQIERVSRHSPGVPVILAGDFNCNVWDVPYCNFIERGFVDTYRAAGHGDSLASSTYHGYVGEAYSGLEWGDEQCWRVDWILTRDGTHRLQTVASTITHDAIPPIYPSDHWPIITDLSMR